MRLGCFKVFRDFLQQLFAFFFVLQTALWPSMAEAGRKTASVRGAQGTVLPSNFRHPSHKQMIDLTREAALNSFGRFIERSSSTKELTGFLLSAMSKKDREEMAPILEKMSLPEKIRLRARRVGDALEVSADGFEKVVVRWPKFPENTLNINGVDWTISTHQSIRFNLEILMARLAPLPPSQSRGSSAMLQILLPNAQASLIGKIADWLEHHRMVVPSTIFATVVLTNIVNGLWSAGYNLICSYAHQANEFMSASCTTYLENLAKSRQLRDSIAKIETALPSKKGKIDGQGETEEKWLSTNGKECPHDKDRVFIADVILTKTTNGSMKAITPWYTVRAELDADTSKKIQYAVIAPGGTDMNNQPEREERAHAIFRVEPTSGKQVIDIRNQDKSSPDPMVTIPVDADESKLRSWEVPENKRWQEFIRQLAFLVEACRTELNLKKLAEEEAKKAAAGQPSSIPKEPEAAKQLQAPPVEAPAKTTQ